MNSDRFSGRVDHSPADHQTPHGRPVSSAKESLPHRTTAPTRVTDASARRVAAQLTDVDRRVLETISTVRIASGAQLHALHWADSDTGRRMARHHLAKLTELRVLARLDRRIGGVRAGSAGFTYTLDTIGLRLVDDGTASITAGRTDKDTTTSKRIRRPSTPGDRYLDHALAITDCYVALKHLEHTTDFELLGFQSEPRSWRQFAGPDARPQTIKPDAFALLADATWEHRWFLEIDRATEHRPTILRKATEYITYWQTGTEQRVHDLFPRVLWVTPSDRRTEDIRFWLTTLDPATHHLFQVCSAADFESAVQSAALEVDS